MQEQSKQSKALTTIEAAAYIKEVHGVNVAPSTLERKRSKGGGPVFEKFNGKAIYRPPALDEWVRSNTSPPRRFVGEAVADAR